METIETTGFKGHVILELMGHVRLAGFVTQEELFGTKMGRIEVPRPEFPCKHCAGGGRVLPLETGSTCPECNGAGKLGGGTTTVWFSGQSVYRMTPVSEEVARQVALRSQPAPVNPWELQPKALTAPVSDYSSDDDDEREEDWRP